MSVGWIGVDLDGTLRQMAAAIRASREVQQ